MGSSASLRVAGYKITRRLPGPGEAYLAQTTTGRHVVLRPLAPSPQYDIDVVRREVIATASLPHPSVLKVVDLLDQDDLLIIAFDYFPGTKLAQILKHPQWSAALEPVGVWQLGLDLVGALTLAHSSQDDEGLPAPVCHGHLSPAAITVGHQSGEVRVEGLGLASLVAPRLVAIQPGYRAPEERSGGAPTPRGDLYAVAVLLWACLANQAPPAGGDDKISLGAIAAFLPAAMREPLELALEPSLQARRITGVEFEQALRLVVDPEQGRRNLGEVATAVVQSGRTLGGPGRSIAGGADAGPAASPALADPVMPGTPAQADNEAAAAALGRVGIKPNPRARQKTLLGAFKPADLGAPPDAAPGTPPADVAA
ncbi:MAG: hypothetical protein JRI23_00860, partial [Deltaproteobacteria bacterium]|nr:hypothetical protein [Deltaproteobacteria bacterium]MBW2530003.1 hypothetical protein [Deltaproteobacteria bacterium]